MVKKLIRNNKGFTLVELLVSVLILSIMATAFITLLSSSFSNVFTSGNRSKALFEAQDKLEVQMAVGTSESTSNIAIEFDARVGVAPVIIEGKIVEESVNYDGKVLKLTSFLVKR